MNTPYIEWDTWKVLQDHAQYLQEEGMDEKSAFDAACRDTFLIEDAWEFLTTDLTALIEQINPDGHWMAEVKNFGWRSIDGTKVFRATTGEQLLYEVLPHTDNHFKVFVEDRIIKIQNFHHDSPTGKEWYTITPEELT